jgi:hypothetical protein
LRSHKRNFKGCSGRIPCAGSEFFLLASTGRCARRNLSGCSRAAYLVRQGPSRSCAWA